MNKEFEMYFNGPSDIDRQMIDGQTLLRWNHPEHGVAEPGDFFKVMWWIRKSILLFVCWHPPAPVALLTVMVDVGLPQFGDQP